MSQIFKLKPTPGTGIVGPIRHGPEYWERINRRAAELKAAGRRKEREERQLRLPGIGD